MTNGTVTLREMRWWDIEPVLELERELFPDDAWSRGLFWSELAHARGPHATRRYIVAETGAGGGPAASGEIVGYGGLAAVDRTGDIQTIAAARAYWGTGLGARLLGDLLAGAGDFDCREVLLEVRIDNTRAQRLYERFGFEPIGLRPNYYQPGNVDAVVMRRAEPFADEAAEDRTVNDSANGSANHSANDSANNSAEQGMTNDG
ncbi:ribosomal protein S18-alanine N-acetyltransferase [Streptomyces sp. 8N616]|uniref:ribosomal protein S18-alanine N-acetyltransferase n=1 Tax=Streptomyces sp. 8N616 TaxID=3457414 RepID=UPI003FD5C2B4